MMACGVVSFIVCGQGRLYILYLAEAFFLLIVFSDIIAQVAHIYIWACFSGRQLASAPVSIWGLGRIYRLHNYSI